MLKLDLESMSDPTKSNNDASFWSVLQAETNSLVSSAKLLENHKALEMLKKNISTSEKVLEQLVQMLLGL